jgi:multisubunit Na+/H+ antiporter MnhB subunit
MFIFDPTTCIVAAVSFIIVYIILDYLNLENIETKDAKISYSLVISTIITGLYSWFLAHGQEELIKESFPEAAIKFGGVAELDNVRNLCNI